MNWSRAVAYLTVFASCSLAVHADPEAGPDADPHFLSRLYGGGYYGYGGRNSYVFRSFGSHYQKRPYSYRPHRYGFNSHANKKHHYRPHKYYPTKHYPAKHYPHKPYPHKPVYPMPHPVKPAVPFKPIYPPQPVKPVQPVEPQPVQPFKPQPVQPFPVQPEVLPAPSPFPAPIEDIDLPAGPQAVVPPSAELRQLAAVAEPVQQQQQAVLLPEAVVPGGQAAVSDFSGQFVPALPVSFDAVPPPASAGQPADAVQPGLFAVAAVPGASGLATHSQNFF